MLLTGPIPGNARNLYKSSQLQPCVHVFAVTAKAIEKEGLCNFLFLKNDIIYDRPSGLKTQYTYCALNFIGNRHEVIIPLHISPIDGFRICRLFSVVSMSTSTF